MSWKEAVAVGSAMNARGSTEVIIATIGLAMGILSHNLFTMIVTMAVVTTLIMPPMLRWALGRLPMIGGGKGTDRARGARRSRLRRQAGAPSARRRRQPGRTLHGLSLRADRRQPRHADDAAEGRARRCGGGPGRGRAGGASRRDQEGGEGERHRRQARRGDGGREGPSDRPDGSPRHGGDDPGGGAQGLRHAGRGPGSRRDEEGRLPARISRTSRRASTGRSASC